jgi:hypothetical protein
MNNTANIQIDLNTAAYAAETSAATLAALSARAAYNGELAAVRIADPLALDAAIEAYKMALDGFGGDTPFNVAYAAADDVYDRAVYAFDDDYRF